MVYFETSICDWSARDQHLEQLLALVDRKGSTASVEPFHLLLYPSVDLSSLFRLTQKHAQEVFSRVTPTDVTVPLVSLPDLRQLSPSNRLRVILMSFNNRRLDMFHQTSRIIL